MVAPTPAQQKYLAKLIEKLGITDDEWRESVGLYEHSPWGKRLRTELITKQRMSRWISDLLIRITAKERDESIE